ncbi:MAG: hypothetical protein LBH13_06060 [Cellulomonadaceae bacterium]|jgi:hypothetical protein|nr:hypothetical protein [Cellulomonadaceae bacterium]
MTTLTIRHVPEQVHSVLSARASRRGQSVQQYMLGELNRIAQQPSLDDVLDQFSHRTGGRAGFNQSVSILTSARSAR